MLGWVKTETAAITLTLPVWPEVIQNHSRTCLSILSLRFPLCFPASQSPNMSNTLDHRVRYTLLPARFSASSCSSSVGAIESSQQFLKESTGRRVMSDSASMCLSSKNKI